MGQDPALGGRLSIRAAGDVDNMPGANSAIRDDFVAKFKADGHVLLVSSSGRQTTNTVLAMGLL